LASPAPHLWKGFFSRMPQPDHRSDEQLVAAANGGDASAMAALYVRYRQWVFALALRFTGDHEQAADVTQEAFAYLLSKFPGLRLRAKLTTLLYPAVKNTALAMKRKKKPLSAGDEVEAYLAPAHPLIADPQDPDQRELAATIARLPDRQREVLLMRAVDDMSMAEIALALGIPEGTVKSRLHHAVRSMQELLKSSPAHSDFPRPH
jgi:RNA polymerase sigma-70 factor, ECF subfamily